MVGELNKISWNFMICCHQVHDWPLRDFQWIISKEVTKYFWNIRICCKHISQISCLIQISNMFLFTMYSAYTIFSLTNLFQLLSINSWFMYYIKHIYCNCKRLLDTWKSYYATRYYFNKDRRNVQKWNYTIHTQ